MDKPEKRPLRATVKATISKEDAILALGSMIAARWDGDLWCELDAKRLEGFAELIRQMLAEKAGYNDD